MGSEQGELAELEAAIGLQFRDRELLRQALIHRSFVHEQPEKVQGSNERMEFLGDAALDLVIAEELYRRFPEATEGELTNLRSALVRTDTLAHLAGQIDLGRYLYLGRGEEASGGRSRWPNVGRAYEALIGAIYLDQGIEACRAFLLRQISDDLIGAAQRGRRDYKSALQELAQAQFGHTPVYRVVRALGPDHDKIFTVEVLIGDRAAGRGEGRSKQTAEQFAAAAALQALSEAEASSESEVVPELPDA